MSESRFLMTGSSEKDDVNRVIQAALFVRVPLEMEGTIQAPVITLQVLEITRSVRIPARSIQKAVRGMVGYRHTRGCPIRSHAIACSLRP